MNNIYIRKTGDAPIPAKMFSAWVGVLAFAFLGIILQGLTLSTLLVPELSLDVLILAAVVGILGMSTMTYAAQFGVTHIPVNQSAILFLCEVPVGAVSAAAWAGETVSSQEWLGGCCIMIAAVLTAQSTIKQSSST